MASKLIKGPGKVVSIFQGSSPMVDGELVLRSNETEISVNAVTRVDPWYKVDAKNAASVLKIRSTDGLPGLYGSYWYQPAELTNKLYSKLRDQLYNGETAALIVDMAERNKTWAMLADAATRVAHATTLILKGRFGKAAKALGMNHIPRGVHMRKPFSENWLAYRYGWGPFLGSIESTVGVLASPLTLEYPIQVRSHLDGAYYEQQQGTYVRALVQPPRWKGSCRTVVRVDVPSFARAHQFINLNPAMLLYETTMLSFVSEWFSNLSDVIQSWDQLPGLSFPDGVWYTYKYSTLVDYLHLDQSKSLGYKYVWYPAYGGLLTRKWRIRTSTPVPPTLVFGNNMNTKRALDALALCSVLLRK